MLIDVYPEYERDLQKIFDDYNKLYDILLNPDIKMKDNCNMYWTDNIRNMSTKTSMKISRLQKLLKQYRDDEFREYIKEDKRKQEERERFNEIRNSW